jgi:TfoX/Sxy family transcriptional regulator of competence genes
MAHDAVLAQRLRALLREEPGVSEKAMFGGLAFLVDGHLAVSVSHLGGLLLRVEPEQAEELLDGSSVDLFEMRGRRLRGWLHVAADVVADDESLEEWVDRGVRHARSLPTEDASRPRRG